MPPHHHELESGVPSCGTPRTHRHYVVERPPGDQGGCTTQGGVALHLLWASHAASIRDVSSIEGGELGCRPLAWAKLAMLRAEYHVWQVSCCQRQQQMVATRCIQATPNHLDHIYSLNYACMIHNQLLVLKTRPKPTNIQCIHNQWIIICKFYRTVRDGWSSWEPSLIF